MAERNLRDSSWTLYSSVSDDIDNISDMSQEASRVLKMRITQKIADGFQEAIKRIKVRSASVEVVSHRRLQIMLPDATFGKRSFSHNWCEIINTNPISGSLYISLHGSASHPHCDSGGDFCWGSGMDVLEKVKHERYDLALIALIDVVQTFVPSAAFRTPSRSLICRIDGCDQKGEDIDPFDSYAYNLRSPDHTMYVCNLHRKRCSFSNCRNRAHVSSRGLFFCQEHSILECNSCGAKVNATEVIVRFTGGRMVVTACGNCSVQCTHCGNLVPKADAKVFMDRQYCGSCFIYEITRANLSSTDWLDARQEITCQTNQNESLILTVPETREEIPF